MASHIQIPADEEPSSDAIAQDEVDAFALRKELEVTELRQEHQRTERLRIWFAIGVRLLVAIIFFWIAIALSVVAWHYLTPESLQWMEPDALGTVSTVLFSGTLFVFLGLYVRDRVTS